MTIVDGGGGCTVIEPLTVTPPAAGVTGVGTTTEPAVVVNVVRCAPAATVTAAGTASTAALVVLSVMGMPPAGAKPSTATVTVTVAPLATKFDGAEKDNMGGGAGGL